MLIGQNMKYHALGPRNMRAMPSEVPTAAPATVMRDFVAIKIFESSQPPLAVEERSLSLAHAARKLLSMPTLDSARTQRAREASQLRHCGVARREQSSPHGPEQH